jgi:hypothetical protein
MKGKVWDTKNFAIYNKPAYILGKIASILQDMPDDEQILFEFELCRDVRPKPPVRPLRRTEK